MPWNLFVFPVVAGYCFVHVFYYTRYRAYGLSGERLLLEAVGVGMALGIPVYLFSELLATRFPSVHSLWQAISPFDHSGKAALLLAGSVCVPWLANRFVERRFERSGQGEAAGSKGRVEVARRILRKYGDPLTRLFLSAFVRQQEIQVSMDRGKVYVGWVVMSLGLNPKTRYIRLLPVLSGYRHPENHTVMFTTEYADIYERLAKGDDEVLSGFTASDFQVVLPLERIESARLFDLRVYRKHFTEKQIS